MSRPNAQVKGRHTFDGDGMIISVAFRDGRAWFRNRFVLTDGFVREQVRPANPYP